MLCLKTTYKLLVTFHRYYVTGGDASTLKHPVYRAVIAPPLYAYTLCISEQLCAPHKPVMLFIIIVVVMRGRLLLSLTSIWNLI